MDIDPHVPLHDAVALAEIDLYTDVLAAVGEADAPLTTDELDRVLGLRPRTAQSASPMRLVLDEDTRGASAAARSSAGRTLGRTSTSGPRPSTGIRTCCPAANDTYLTTRERETRMRQFGGAPRITPRPPRAPKRGPGPACPGCPAVSS